MTWQARADLGRVEVEVAHEAAPPVHVHVEALGRILLLLCLALHLHVGCVRRGQHHHTKGVSQGLPTGPTLYLYMQSLDKARARGIRPNGAVPYGGPCLRAAAWPATWRPACPAWRCSEGRCAAARCRPAGRRVRTCAAPWTAPQTWPSPAPDNQANTTAAAVSPPGPLNWVAP